MLFHMLSVVSVFNGKALIKTENPNVSSYYDKVRIFSVWWTWWDSNP